MHYTSAQPDHKVSRNQFAAFCDCLVEATHRHKQLQRKLAVACKVRFSLYFPLCFGTSPKGLFAPNNGRSVYWPYKFRGWRSNSKSLSRTQILGTEVHWQEEYQALGRYIYWQISPTVKGQKHVLQLHKNKSGPSTLCFGTEPPVLRQIKCKAAEYSHCPQPAQSRNLRYQLHNLKLLFESFLLRALLCVFFNTRLTTL